MIALAAATMWHTAVEAQAGRAAAASDAMFLARAAATGQAEVELGRIAVEKAYTPAVKRFAQRMVDDHGKAGEELAALAQHKGLALSTDIGPAHRAEREKLSKLSDEAFDRAYIQAMLAGHRRVINEFGTESRLGTDTEIRAWAAKMLPTIQQHLTMAEDAERAIKANPIHH
jgi:putative membrane protein